MNNGITRLKAGVPGAIRTLDPLLRRQLLYPLSYRDGCYSIKSSTKIVEGQGNPRPLAARPLSIGAGGAHPPSIHNRRLFAFVLGQC